MQETNKAEKYLQQNATASLTLGVIAIVGTAIILTTLSLLLFSDEYLNLPLHNTVFFLVIVLILTLWSPVLGCIAWPFGAGVSASARKNGLRRPPKAVAGQVLGMVSSLGYVFAILLCFLFYYME